MSRVMTCVWQFLYRDLLQPGDTFPTQMRKLILALGGLASILPVYSLLSVSVTTPDGFQIEAARMAMLLVILLGPYVFVKCTHTAPTWLIGMWSNGANLFLIFSVVWNPNGVYNYAFIGMMIVVFLSHALAKGII